MVLQAKSLLKKGSEPLTADEIAAINLYTQETPLYTTLNTALRKRDRKALMVWFPYLKILITAVHKLEPINTTVYRGVKLDLSQRYQKGDDVVWWSFSSATESVEVLKNPMFLGDNGQRTLFSVNIHSGVDIRRYSAIPEDERLIIPGTQLIVKGHLSLGAGLLMIQLEEDPHAESLIAGFKGKSAGVKVAESSSVSSVTTNVSGVTNAIAQMTTTSQQGVCMTRWI